MQVSDQVRFVVDAIAERVRMATYEASAYRTQRQRFEGNDATSVNSHFSQNNNNNNFYNQQQQVQNPQLLLINDTPLFKSPATHLSVAQTNVNANRQEIVDYAMKRVASSPASTRVAHDKKTQHQTVYDDLLQQNSQKLTYQMAMQTLKNVQTNLEFGRYEENHHQNSNNNNTSLPPRSPPPSNQQQQQLRPTFLDENDREDFLNGTQKPSSPSSLGRVSPSRTKTFATSSNSEPSNYGQLQWQNRNNNNNNNGNNNHGIIMTGLLVPSSTMSGRDILAQRQVDEVLFGKKMPSARSSSTYKHPTSSSLARKSYSLNAPRNSHQVFVRTTTAASATNNIFDGHNADDHESYLLHGGTNIPLPTAKLATQTGNNNNNNNTNNNFNAKFSYEAGFISDTVRKNANETVDNQQTARSSRSPESAMGGRTAAPTTTSTKIFSSSNYMVNNNNNNTSLATDDESQMRNTSVGALRNHRDVSGFVEYNPEYEKFRRNVQTSLRAASDNATRFLPVSVDEE